MNAHAGLQIYTALFLHSTIQFHKAHHTYMSLPLLLHQKSPLLHSNSSHCSQMFSALQKAKKSIGLLALTFLMGTLVMSGPLQSQRMD
jgi:hypothetical protein